MRTIYIKQKKSKKKYILAYFIGLFLAWITLELISALNLEWKVEAGYPYSKFEAVGGVESVEDKEVERSTEKIENEEVLTTSEIIDTTLTTKIETSRSFVSSYRDGNNPIIDNVEVFYDNNTEMKARLALAICGAETAFGTIGDRIGEFNCWGWQAYLGDSWEENIRVYMLKADGYLSLYDGTVESLIRIADAGYYPTSDEAQKEWGYRVQDFYNKL